MYPLIRSFTELALARRMPPLRVGEIHVSHHRCWPWDIDPWLELNNGRTLTLFDLGRLPLAMRMGLLRVVAREKWVLTVAGVSVRYRRRVKPLHRFEMRSRVIGWDARFIYLEQSMWLGDEAANQGLYRMAVADKSGLVPTDRVAAAMGLGEASPPLPAWVAAWIAAEDKRPWPPEIGAPGN